MTNESFQHEEVESLENEVKIFANSLPYFSKYLSKKLLQGQKVSESDIDTAYRFLLENSGLLKKTEQPKIAISTCKERVDAYTTDLLLKKVTQVEGVNALAEEQTIEFNPNLTIIYGANGSGKSGYIRLFKKAFISRNNEEICQNIYLTAGHKKISADFAFESIGNTYTLNYPKDINKTDFLQFSVFDNKAASVHLNEKNEFEFRPIGLNYFSELIKIYKILNSRLTDEIAGKSIHKDYVSLFSGESEIKDLINGISDKTNIENIKKYTPYTKEDQKVKNSLEEKRIELLTIKKDKEIEILEEIKQLINELITNIEETNKFFIGKSLTKIQNAIVDLNSKKTLAKNEGTESFKTDLIKNIGSVEWKDFIESAEIFSTKQEKLKYPENGDFCIFCHQSLSPEAQKLILRYWAFIKSQIEIELQEAQKHLKSIKTQYREINFNVIPQNTILFKWLGQNYPKTLKDLHVALSTQKTLSDNIIADIEEMKGKSRDEFLIETICLEYITLEIDKEIRVLRDSEPTKELEKIAKKIIFLEHKQKISEHISKIEEYLNQLKWVSIAEKVKIQLSTRKITSTEKDLSSKYFNQDYVKAFNLECKKLNGNFGIKVKHTGKLGCSYRELKIKDRIPSEILSEGEQKVISLADFIAEIHLSGLNKGLIFDDPVNSLDNERKSNIAKRLTQESLNRQVIVFTHDLVFVSCLIEYSSDYKSEVSCHWIENIEGKPGTIWLNNSPSFEKMYKTSGKAQAYYTEAIKCSPEDRETKIKNGFASLRTSYKALVVFDLFGGVVQRFNERVSIDSLSNVYFDTPIKNEIMDSFYQCCRYMEGHSHSDKYSYKKPETNDLKDEISRFDTVKKKLKLHKKKG